MNPAPSALAWGPEGLLIYNDHYASICGSRHPRALGASLRDAWPEAWDFNRAMLESCRSGTPQVFRDAHFILEREGVLRDSWFDLYYAPVCATGEHFEGVLATVVEITDRMRIEQAREAHARELQRLNTELDTQRGRLEAANRRLAGDMQFISDLFQCAPGFMAVLLGPDHRFELHNAAYDQLVQHRAVRGTTLAEALPEVAEQGFVDLLDQVYRSGTQFRGQDVEVLLHRGGQGRDRRIVDFVFQPLKNENGATYGIFVEGADVTARALAEERLRVAQEAGGIGTFEWYPQRGELTVSDAYRRLWGIGPDTPVTDGLLLGLVDTAYLEYSGSHRFGQMDNPLEYAEYPIRRADTGQRRWIARKGQLVSMRHEQEPRYLGVAFDITDRKIAEQALRASESRLRELNESLERTVGNEVAERVKAEDALRHAQKMEAVGQLASGVAHDFNNVLQIISSNLQLMARGTGGAARQEERLGQALGAVERGSRLSLQLLAFGRKQALQPVVTHLGRILGEIAPLLERALGDGVALSLRFEPALWCVAVDRNQIENAVLNMAINARDAMQGKGRLAIAARNLAAAGSSERVALSLADSGCGMSAEVVAKVFDPFYTTKAAGKGTGLGMSMVYGFVKQSGGNIRIDSTPGNGTTITIELPRAAGEHEEVAQAGSAAIERGHETILLVEDDPSVRAVTVDMLAALGYAVLTAADGEQALAILRSKAAIDLLFSDVSMPGRVGSSELVRHATELAPSLPVLLASGHAVDRALLDDGLPLDVALLPKPYTLSALAHAVRAQLDAAGHARAPRDAAMQSDGTALRFLVVEDDAGSRELACEMLQALGYAAHGTGSGETALALLACGDVDVLFTDLNLPGMPGDVLAARACAIKPSLQVILSSGEGRVELDIPGCPLMQLPKPYDLLQLRQTIDAVEGRQGAAVILAGESLC